MAENDAAVEEKKDSTEEQEFAYPVKIEDAGPATKKVTVEVPRERIDTVMEEQFTELRSQAAIPGFRPGHAPRKLVEKRFGDDVKEQVRRKLIAESYEQAVEKNSLQVIGEPEFDNPDAIKLPESGALSYSFQVEVQPEFTIPDLANLKVKKPKIEVTEENVDQAMQNLREQQGTLIPVEDRGIQARDRVIADVQIKVDGKVIGHNHEAEFVARPGKVSGIDVPDLDKQLEGAKGGETRTVKVHVADTHPLEQIRGKDVEIDFAIKDIKFLELIEITPEFLEELGFESEKELREALREQMVERITMDIQSALRDQVHKYLLDNTTIDLPSKLSERQEQRIISRRAIDLTMKGVPQDQIVSNIERLRQGAKDEGAKELKLFFILEKIATDKGVEVSEGELNSQVAMMAIQRGERPEKLRQKLAKDGTLSNMYVQMRENKAVDELLKSAQIEEVDLQS